MGARGLLNRWGDHSILRPDFLGDHPITGPIYGGIKNHNHGGIIKLIWWRIMGSKFSKLCCIICFPCEQLNKAKTLEFIIKGTRG